MLLIFQTRPLLMFVSEGDGELKTSHDGQTKTEIP